MYKTVAILSKGEATAIMLDRGQRVRITCVDGGQLADLVFLSYHQGLTLDNLRRFSLNDKDLIYNYDEEPVLEVEEIHSKAETNIIYPGCRRKFYQDVFKKDKDGCRDLLAKALGVQPNELPSTINLFMDYEIKDHRFNTRPSKVKEGDYNTFKALKNCRIAVSACPCESNACRSEGKIKIEISEDK